MKTKNRFIAVGVLLLLCLFTSIISIFVDYFTGFHKVPTWGSYDYYHSRHFYKNNQSHFGDIEAVEGEDGRVRFGSRTWTSYQITEDMIEEENLHGGTLVRFYQYYDNNVNSKYYGEAASIRVYDISELICPDGEMLPIEMDNEKYQQMAKKYCPIDSSFYQLTDKFSPNIAVESSTFYKWHSGRGLFMKQVIVFANERAYHFSLVNDKIESEGMKTFNKLDHRFSGIVSKIDFDTYRNWKEEYVDNIQSREKSRMINLILSLILGVLMSAVALVSVRHIGRQNLSARKQTVYLLVCSLISVTAFLILAFFAFKDHWDDEAKLGLFWIPIPVTIVYSAILITCCSLSHKEYEKFYLIPPFVKNTICQGSEVKCRLLLLLYFLPLYYIAPIPVAGWFVFVYYILPMTVLIAIWYAIAWVLGDKKVSISLPAVNLPTKQKRFCRHCGKPIDPSARFCRHCGKEV